MSRETRNATPPAAGFGHGATGYRSSENGIIPKEGEYWTVGYGGKSFRLKENKGLGSSSRLSEVNPCPSVSHVKFGVCSPRLRSPAFHLRLMNWIMPTRMLAKRRG
jgi:hypothetical protein